MNTLSSFFFLLCSIHSCSYQYHFFSSECKEQKLLTSILYFHNLLQKLLTVLLFWEKEKEKEKEQMSIHRKKKCRWRYKTSWLRERHTTRTTLTHAHKFWLSDNGEKSEGSDNFFLLNRLHVCQMCGDIERKKRHRNK